MDLPLLKKHEGSYIITHIQSGDVVMEINKNDKRLRHLNFKKYKAIGILEYLSSLNNKQK